jgi:Family of unknown function (DUF6069)
MTATVAPTATAPATASAPASGLRSALATKPLWLVGVAASVVAAVVTALVASVARAADVPLEVASSSGDAPEVIPTSGFAVVVLAAGAIGVVLALALDRWAKRPARTFVVVTGVLTVISFATPVLAENATTATRVVLELTHVAVAAIVIPTIAYRLGRRPAR